MPVDKNSPQYEAYIAECKSLFEDADRREAAYLAEYPDWLGQDHPNGDKIRAIMTERNIKFRKIKEKYGFSD